MTSIFIFPYMEIVLLVFLVIPGVESLREVGGGGGEGG